MLHSFCSIISITITTVVSINFDLLPSRYQKNTCSLGLQPVHRNTIAVPDNIVLLYFLKFPIKIAIGVYIDNTLLLIHQSY